MASGSGTAGTSQGKFLLTLKIHIHLNTAPKTLQYLQI